jgi:hypothetical protein
VGKIADRVAQRAITREREVMHGTCQTCSKYSGLHSECRAHPPVVFFLGVNAEGQPGSVAFWPSVRKDFWCAEHEIDGAHESPREPKGESVLLAGNGHA